MAEETAEDRARITAEALSRFVNDYGADLKTFATVVTNEHRTLQQSMFRAMLLCIKMWAEKAEGQWYDLRNEDTVKTCKRLQEVLDAENIGYVRFV